MLKLEDTFPHVANDQNFTGMTVVIKPSALNRRLFAVSISSWRRESLESIDNAATADLVIEGDLNPDAHVWGRCVAADRALAARSERDG